VTTNKKIVKKVAPKTKAHALTSSSAILGSVATPKGSKKPGVTEIKPQWVKFYQHLMELRDRLVAQMNGLAEETTQEMPSYSLHMADSGTDNFDRDFALSLLSSDQDAMYEIEEALKRIEKNTYGVCELTGKPIPKARLEAIPWTRFTVEAQAQLERDGALRARRLGSLGTVDNAGTVEVESDDEEGAAAGDEKQPNKEKE
jgi:RNA polymerase-binding transcription factor DksA